MDIPTRERILTILRGVPARSLPLRELHRRLCLEAGIASPTLRELESLLQLDGYVTHARATSPVQFLGDHVGPSLRDEYESALRAAGLECDMQVTLPEDEHGGTTIDPDWTAAALERSITALRRHTRHDRLLRERLREAEAEFAALRAALHSRLP